MAPPGHGLPDEIVIWEILVRLPPRDILRCRAVCRAWRRDASTCEFLLAHHDHQPSLPLLRRTSFENGVATSLDLIPYLAGVTSADLLRPVALFGAADGPYLKASCDGLLLFCTRNTPFICNPTTRQYARLPMLSNKMILGMYRHHPTGEYRILFLQGGRHSYNVLALGSGQPSRHVAWPPALERDRVGFNSVAVLLRGRLHWSGLMGRNAARTIVTLDTIGETFQLMHAPVATGLAQLFQLFGMDDMLGMTSFNDAKTIFDIWMMQDYKSEVWTYKWRVILPAMEINVQCGQFYPQNVMIAAPKDGKFFVLVQFHGWLFQVDSDGKLVASFPCEFLFFGLTQHRLKQTLVSHSFFPKLDGYAVNASPFISTDNYVVNT